MINFMILVHTCMYSLYTLAKTDVHVVQYEYIYIQASMDLEDILKVYTWGMFY